MNVNFVLTGGSLIEPYRRAIKSAEVHNAPIVLWHVGDRPDIDVACRKVDVPTWLENQPANVIYSYLAYKLARRYGGMWLGLDIISFRSAFHLLGSHEIVVSRDVPDDDTAVEHKYNDNFLCQPSSKIIWEICETAKQKILQGGLQWGAVGPVHLTKFVQRYPDKMVGASFGALNGFSGSTIWKWYCSIQKPPANCCTLHCYATAYPELFYREDIAEWVQNHPDFFEAVKNAPCYPKVDPAIYI